MKKIAASVIFKVRPPPTDGLSVEVLKLREEAIYNKSMVIEGAITTERTLANIISKFFFESQEERAIVLNSDGYPFSEKLKVVRQIIVQQGLAKENDKFFEDLYKAMNYRNRFTHGTLAIELPKVWLEYFDKKPVSKELTDEYLTEVEATLSRTQQAAEAFREKIRKQPLP